jgi:hypothetical protein
LKVQCELCKEIVELTYFRPSARGIDITCSACGRSYFVQAPAKVGGSEAEPGAIFCPKCGEPSRAGASSCRRCGLAVERFEQFRDELATPASDPLQTLWGACEADWVNPSAHERFLAAAAVAESYQFAAAAYRNALRDRPGDQVAERYLAEVRRRAEAHLLQSAAAGRYQDDVKEPFRNLTLLMVVLVALAAVGLVYAFFMSGGAVAPDGPAG